MCPIYVYKCEECGYQMEDYRTISKRDNKTVCNACSNEMIRLKVVGEPHVIYKGNGWCRPKDYKSGDNQMRLLFYNYWKPDSSEVNHYWPTFGQVIILAFNKLYNQYTIIFLNFSVTLEV